MSCVFRGYSNSNQKAKQYSRKIATKKLQNWDQNLANPLLALAGFKQPSPDLIRTSVFVHSGGITNVHFLQTVFKRRTAESEGFKSSFPLLYRLFANVCVGFLCFYIITKPSFLSDQRVLWISLCLQNSLEKIDNCVHTGSDLFFVLYSTIDRASFEEASLLCQYLLKTKNINPACLVLVGNKSDLKHFREVEEYEGRLLAQALECGFCQLSASEGFDDSQTVLYNTLRQYVNTQKHGSPSIRVFIDNVLSRKKSMS